MLKHVVSFIGKVLDEGKSLRGSGRFGLLNRPVSYLWVGLLLFVALVVVVSPAILMLYLASLYPDNSHMYIVLYFVVIMVIIALIVSTIIALTVKSIRKWLAVKNYKRQR